MTTHLVNALEDTLEDALGNVIVTHLAGTARIFLSRSRIYFSRRSPSDRGYKMANAPGMASSIWLRHLEPANTLGGTFV